MRTLLLIVLLIVYPLHAQENCTNGVDDDGDGFIDLNDGECLCVSAENLVYNGDFELYTEPETPLSPWTIENADGWLNPTNSLENIFALASYHNKEYIDGMPETDFPSGFGAASVLSDYLVIDTGSGEFEGEIQQYRYKEFLGTNLIEPLDPGKIYVFSAFIYRQNTLDWVTWPQMGFGLWGKSGQILPYQIPFSACPDTVVDWTELKMLPFIPTNDWIKVEGEFIVEESISSIIVGLNCTLPFSFYSLPGTKIIGIDDVFIREVSDELSLTASGSPCMDEVVLSAQHSQDFEPQSYQWYMNGTAISGATSATYLLNDSTPEGYYTVRAVDASNQCRLSTAYGYIKPEFNFNYQLILDETEGSVRLDGIEDVYEYSFAIDGGDFQSEPYFGQLEQGSHTITVLSNEGCLVKEIGFVIFKLYNIITPNGDGLNDVWWVEGLHLYPKSTVRIFDRYGIERYAYQIPEGLQEFTWDGTVNGSPLASGTYYYIIDVADERQRSGTITIKRR